MAEKLTVCLYNPLFSSQWLPMFLHYALENVQVRNDGFFFYLQLYLSFLFHLGISLVPHCAFCLPPLLFSLFQPVFLSQADSYPVLPNGLEEFPNGHSDVYHAAWKLWVFFSSCLLCLTLPFHLPFLCISPPLAWLLNCLSLPYSKRSTLL